MENTSEAVPSNPNNCETCKYHPDPDATGHCYMFRDEPTDVCMQHSGRAVPIIAVENGQLVLSQAFRALSAGGFPFL